MDGVFLKVLNMSIAASWLLLAVMLLRFALKRAPKWTVVLLWGIAALRLAVPFSFESALSLIPSAETFNMHNIQFETPAISSGIPAVNSVVNPVLGETFAPNPGGSVNPLHVWTFIVSVIWLTGIAVMLLYAVVSYIRVRRSVAERVPCEGNIFLCDHVKSPFILGLAAPKIYLPSNMDATAMEPVIAHEKAHLARRDHWWKPLGFLVLTVHWFNPLCWIAYVLLCRDIELACDEKVIRQMDLDGKKQYSTALLECSTGRRLVTICPLAFGEVGVKQRVKNVLNYKKPAFWVIVAAVIACAVVTVCFATNPVRNSFDLAIHFPAESEERVFYTDEEVSSQSGVIEIVAGQGLGDTMIQLLPVEVSEENAYDEPQYITPGMPVKFQVEKGAWFRIGVGPLLVESTEDVYISVKNVDVRIASHTETRKLTLDDVVMLSQKGDALTWSDFERYQGQETGSGLYIMRYEIDELFEVRVGGLPDETPMYIYLKVNNEAEDRIDIRTEDVFAFIEAHRIIEVLRDKYPEYFELGTFKGLEVYAWQMAENYYRFGLMQGTNREKTLEEKMALKGVSAEEMALILSTYDIEDKNIFVIPWQPLYSSYMLTEGVLKDPKYISNIRAMLGLEAVSMDSAEINDAEAADEPNLQDAQFTLNEDGCVVTTVNGEIVQISEPVPVPAEWAWQDVGRRNEATTLVNQNYFCAGLVSSTAGWLVISWSRGVAVVDTYVYRTADGGLTWTETNHPRGTDDNYTWLPNQVGFLSADRLLIAFYRFFGTPVFLTKDGGATWEALDMPRDLACDVENIRVDGNTVTISLGGDTRRMVSHDFGDTWEYEPDAKGSGQTSGEAVSTTD